MNRETFINEDKTILNTDFYLYLLKCEDNQNKLISFLEDKLKRRTNQQKNETGLDWAYDKGYIDMIKIVLDFVNKGGK